jgi:hypothetical protein
MWTKKISILLILSFILATGCDLSFAQSNRGIRSIDFRNFTYHLSGGSKVKLINGYYKKIYDSDYNEVFTSELAILKYADFDGDGKEEAVVLLQSTEGGSNHGANDYFIFAYRAGKLRQIFHEHTEGPEGLCLKNRSITIIAEAWEKKELPIPHCCPPFTETKTYRWRGSRFVLIKTDRQRNEPYKNRGAFEKARQCENIR